MADVSSEDEIASFNDSDQFDEDSLSICSWFSEHDSISAITWNGWKKSSNVQTGSHSCNYNNTMVSLVDICAKMVAEHFPFQAVEEHHPPVPEQIQLKIAYWSFPRKENNIQLYSCIAHGTLDEFHLAELILRWKNIRNVIQIGFHLTGMVMGDKFKDEYSIAVTFDRCQIITCACSCHATSKWCSHVIALCLFRIRHPDLVSFRPPISESLSRLKRDQLQKFAQYFINELPPKVLPIAQGLLDQLLSDPCSKINEFAGAPDLTAGAGYSDEPAWNLDGETLREKIRKIIGKLCGLSPVAFVDLNPSFFTSSAPTISDEWVNLLRPMVSREPEAMWNLFDIIKSLLRAQDSNSVQILQIVTEELLNFPQLPLWWFVASTEVDSNCFIGNSTSVMQQNHTSANSVSAGYARNTVARLFDEIVQLWKTVMIVPCGMFTNRDKIKDRLVSWHEMALEKTRRGFAGREQKFSDAAEKFFGFKPAIDAGSSEWRAYLTEIGASFDSIGGLSNCNDISSGKPSSQGSLQDLPKVDYIDGLYSCLTAFHTLGLSSIARPLAVELAEYLFSQFAADQNHLSVAVKSADVCKVLKDAVEYQRLAFQLGLQCLSTQRKPSKTKFEEVKFANCEMNLRSALKTMTIGHAELDLIRTSAKKICSFCDLKEPHSRPFIFVIYVLEVFSGAAVQSRTLVKVKNKFFENCVPSHEDKQFAYDFALKSLGWTCYASDQNHSMLCESFRHFRNDLAETLVWHFRNCKDELQEIIADLIKLESYVPSLWTLRTRRKIPKCIMTERPEIVTEKPESYRIHSDSAEEECNVGEIDSQQVVEEDWDLELVCTEGEIQIGNNASKEHQMSTANSENAHHTLSDCAVPNEANLEYDLKQMGDLDSDVFESSRSRLELSPIHYENDGADNITVMELGTKNNANELSVDKSVRLKTYCTTNSEHEHTLVSKKGKGDDGADSHNRDSDFFSLSGSIDGRNTWDPAISWAESSKQESIICERDRCSGYNLSASTDLFPIEVRRTIEKIRLECDSYALFELAKEVLSKSLDDRDEQDSNIVPRPHKQLQLAAFEISIFSLRLHNLISPKWLSRTYSSHVSWIADKCLDIGCAAIEKLNNTWEDVLTPSEVINISSRASRSCDHIIQHAAAELAVSCLPHSHTLNPGEIQQAINMCKEQDIELLERACTSVETSSRNGGILPEILFYVARQWQYIHEKVTDYSISKSKTVHTSLEKLYFNRATMNTFEQVGPTLRPPVPGINEKNVLKMPPGSVLYCKNANSVPDVKLRSRHLSQNQTRGELCQLEHNNPPLVYQDFSRATMISAEQYVQQQMHCIAEEMLKRNHALENPSSRIRSSGNAAELSRIHSQNSVPMNHSMLPAKVNSAVSINDNALRGIDSEASFQLQTAFRVGIKALEALARRGNEESSDLKYPTSPPCSDDIRWLCALTASLGPPYLRKFCKTVISSVSSPFVLHDLALEAARHFAMYNPAQLASYLRSPAVSPIVNKCLTMYSELVKRDLVLLNQNGHSDFVELLRKARSAFCMAPGGMIRFNELLEIVRKSCPRKGELWQLVMNGLSRA